MQQQIAQLEQNQVYLQQQLTQTQQYAVLDKGLSAHLHQLGQFIQNYETIEQQLGNPTLARQKLSEAKSEVEQLTASLGTVEQIELKLEQQRKDKDQKLAQVTQLDLIQQKIKFIMSYMLSFNNSPKNILKPPRKNSLKPFAS